MSKLESELEKESGFKKDSNEYWDYQLERIRLAYKIINERNLEVKTRIIKDELEKCTSLASTRAIAQVLETDRKLTEFSNLISSRRNQPNSAPVTVHAPTTVLQGGTRGVAQQQGLHTPTMAEIIAQGNQRDPAAPYFDTNSDHMRVINPLEPHYDLSGDFPKLVNPLKPGPKISNLG